VNINRIVGRLTASATALLLCMTLSSAAFADTGALMVVITDADGNVTNAAGELRLSGLDPSDAYVVRVTAEGYAPARNEGVLVVSERTFNQIFVMQPADEGLEEIVTYGRTELGQLVDTSSALQSTDVTLEFMD